MELEGVRNNTTEKQSLNTVSLAACTNAHHVFKVRAAVVNLS